MGLLQKLHLLKIAGNVFNLLVVVNSSVNFVLYSSFSSKFRVTFRRLFCHRRLRCKCLGADADELRWLRDNDDDGIEMTYSRADGRTVPVTAGTSPANFGRRRQRGGETVIVVATADGGRTFITRRRSRDRKELAPTTNIEMTSPSQYGLTTTMSMLTPGNSPTSDAQASVSELSVPLVPSEHSDVVPESS